MWVKKSNQIEAIVYIYQSEYSVIIGESYKHSNLETGGDLFGTFTHGDMPVIWLASGPGPKAIHKRAEFSQDTDFTTNWQQRLMKEFGIQYIGTWHSHHRLKLPEPSKGDIRAAKKYARKHNRHRTIEIIITFEGASPQIIVRPFFYPNAQKESWVKSEFSFMSGESPIRRRLGSDEKMFSNEANWRQIFNEFSLDSKICQESKMEDNYNSDHYKKLPPILNSEINNLSGLNYDFEIEVKDDNYMIIITLNRLELLAVAVEETMYKFFMHRVDLINPMKKENSDITKLLYKHKILPSIKDGITIKKILDNLKIIRTELRDKRGY